jgi:hypothetical protein
MRLAFIAALLAVSTASVQAQHLSIGARAGTLGPGVEVSTRLGSHVNIRGGAHYFAYSRADEVRDLEVAVLAESDVTLSSFGVFADVLPFGDVLRVSAGFLWNGNSAVMQITPTEGYTIEGKTFSPERIGSMEASVGHRASIQPYFGLGLGNPMSGRFTVLFDLGLLYTNSPSLTMSGTGMIAPTATQAPDLEAGFYSFRWYPVAALGFGIAF